MVMKVSFSLDDALVSAANATAARHGISVSALVLLNAAHLPHPIVPIADRAAMAAGMVTAIEALSSAS